ncbi:hypothetical protein MC885_005627 [Smutsia gigantea]|nr:hypothetical protein MC885_005627 [Smutsia gigantea]
MPEPREHGAVLWGRRGRPEGVAAPEGAPGKGLLLLQATRRQECHSFTRQVLWKLLKVVQFGETVSYQQLAALAGSPKAARAVGGAMRSNPVSLGRGQRVGPGTSASSQVSPSVPGGR